MPVYGIVCESSQNVHSGKKVANHTEYSNSSRSHTLPACVMLIWRASSSREGAGAGPPARLVSCKPSWAERNLHERLRSAQLMQANKAGDMVSRFLILLLCNVLI